MKKLVTFLAFLISITPILAQPATKRPKLVVGIVIDQMRWDYLYRYYDRYAENGGFKRLLNQGFACENTFIPYTPTVTACGHASIFTGSVPAINGIAGNSWYDSRLNKSVYCTQDDSVKTVGNTSTLGQMSPRNMLTTTIGDELKLATNFRSKVIGISMKDRGSILPAGHSANAAYWYDNKTGDWISSTYYMQDLPPWVKKVNEKKSVDKYYNLGWNTLYPIKSYVQSTEDAKPYESNTFGVGAHFPYDLKKYIGQSYSHIIATPYGNTLTVEMAKEAIVAEQLGQDSITDLLTISFSSPDYIGHSFGPNSIEAEDGFLRLDKELGDLLDFLNEKAGKGQYLLFLSSDHGAAHVPGFLKENKMPNGHVNTQKLFDDLNLSLKEKFKLDNGVVTIDNYQVYLNNNAINANSKLDATQVYKWAVDFIINQPGIANAFELRSLDKTTLPATIKNRVANGFFPTRSGDIQLVFLPQRLDNFESGGTTHGLWNAYDSHIPLLWYGWNIKPGKTFKETYMTDIAPTVSALLQIQMPNGSIGKVIEEVMK